MISEFVLLISDMEYSPIGQTSFEWKKKKQKKTEKSNLKRQFHKQIFCISYIILFQCPNL